MFVIINKILLFKICIKISEKELSKSSLDIFPIYSNSIGIKGISELSEISLVKSDRISIYIDLFSFLPIRARGHWFFLLNLLKISY